MNAVAIIGIDLAKRSFRLHGTDANGAALFRRKILRERLLEFLAGQPMCIVAMEACASAHHWGRAISELGHEVRLLPPIDVKPDVKRQKNDAADAEAIAEAASRPSMRFVALKTPAQQARAMVFRTRDMLVRQRTQSINARRGHLAEHGVIAPRGLTHIGRPAATVETPSVALPDGVRAPSRLLLEQIAWLDGRIADLAKEPRLAAADDPEVRRLMTMPGIGPVAAMAIAAFAPPLESFESGRHFAAWPSAIS